MGANATTFVPAYVAGEVLTAADLSVTNSGIPVFADSTARDAAFGGSGEKVLAEGQFAYLESTNGTQYYDGAAWQSVGTTPGLVCVKAETAVTTAASATADNVFTSAYTNYLVLINYTTSTTVFLNVKLRAGGTSASTNYNRQYLNGNASSLAADRQTSQSSYDPGFYTNGDYKSSLRMEIFTPQLAQPTNFISLNAVSPAGYSPINMFTTGNHTTGTAYDGLEILVSSGTWTGTYSIYGYSKTV
jgi:hypothetical protein